MEKSLTASEIQPEKLLAGLRELWREIETGERGALWRACSMTMIVVCEDHAEIARVRQMLGGVMRLHPARVILLELRAGAKPGGRVYAEHRAGEQICSEGIELAADPAETAELARRLGSLVARDLPVTLWCRGARVFSSAVFEPLFALADRVIVDSCASPDAAAAIAAIRNMPASVADLAWTRITGWREAVAARVRDASAIRQAIIEYAGPAAQACATYLQLWIERAAPHARVEMRSVSGETGLRRLEIRTAAGDVSIAPRDARLSELTEEDLIGEELRVTGADPVFKNLLGRD